MTEILSRKEIDERLAEKRRRGDPDEIEALQTAKQLTEWLEHPQDCASEYKRDYDEEDCETCEHYDKCRYLSGGE